MARRRTSPPAGSFAGPLALVERGRRFTLFGTARLSPRLLGAHALLVLGTAASVLALGGFYPSTLSFSTAVLALSCALAWWPSEARRLRGAARIVALVAVALPVFTFLQCLPLPASLVAVLAPANAEVWSRALRPLHEAAPTWVTLSLDPTNTRVEVLRGLTYLLAFLATLRLSARRGGATLICASIAVTGALLALVTLAHGALDAEKVFGVYRPLTPVALRNIGPLLNPNHLAAYLNISVCLALGIALTTDEVRVRVAAALAIASMGAMQVWVGSRAGVALLVFELPFVTALVRIRDSGPTRLRLARVAVGGVVMIAVIGMIVLGLSTAAVSELTNTDTSKIGSALDSLRLLKEHALLGVGRGAFESTYPSVQGLRGYWTWTNPENIVAQWVTEWGVPVSAAAFFALGYALRPNTVASASRTAVGPWAALVVTALHNLVDFNSEMPGIGVALAACAGVAVASRPRGEAVLTRGYRWPRFLALAAAASAVPLIAWAVPTFGHDLLHDRLALREAAEDTTLSRDAFAADVRAAILRHPAERYFPYVAAYRTSKDRNENPIGWIALALERSPTYGRAHALLGDALSERSMAQARLEYRLAMIDEPDMADAIPLRASRIVWNSAGAMELVPPPPLALRVLGVLILALQNRLPATVQALNAEVLRLDPNQVDATLTDLRAARTDIEGGPLAPWCGEGGRECLSRGLALAAQLEREMPGSCTPFTERALLLSSVGQTLAAVNVLKEAIGRVTDRPACLRALITLSVGAHDRPTAEYAVDALIHACSSSEDCVAVEAEAAQAEEKLGDFGLALVHYRRVLAHAPGRTDIEESIARLSSRLELHP